MSEQPPEQPPSTPPRPPSNQPAGGNPPTQPMPASPSAPPVGAAASPPSADPPRTNTWHQVTATPGRRWALGISALAVALLLMVGIGAAGLLVLRAHDRVDLLGNRPDGRSLQEGRGDDRRDGDTRGRHDRRDLRGERRSQGPGGLGSLLGGTPLHGEVTATISGSVQALAFQLGEVTAVSDTSITLKSSDGFVGTYGRTAVTRSRGGPLVKGGQAFVLARASDKVAIRVIATRARVGVAPAPAPAPTPTRTS
jgi:hypothetical protein